MSQLPEDWKIQSIKALKLDISDGNYSSKYPKQSDFIESGIPFIRANNIKNMTVISEDMRFISESQHSELKKGHLKKNDILITTRGDIGQVALVPDHFIGANINAQVVRIGVSESIFFKYLAYILTYKETQKNIKSLETGTALKQLPVKKLDLLKIPLPPLEEQKKIADILSTVDQKIAFVEDNISQTEELKKGLMQKLLTEGIGNTKFKDSEIGRVPESWEVDTLEKHVKIVSGQSPSKFDLKGSIYKFFKVNQLNFCKKYLSESEYVYDESNYQNLQVGTIIFPKRGAAIFTNKVRILDTEGYIDTNLMGLITKDSINNEFLYYWLVAFELSNIADTSSVPQINNKHINPLKIAIPVLAEQQKISEILLSVDQKLEVLKDKKESFEELKKGLMQKLLTGEVRV